MDSSGDSTALDTPQAGDRLRQLFAMQSRMARAFMRSEDPQQIYAAACREAVEQGGLRAAWVGLLEPASRILLPVAQAGLCPGLQQVLLPSRPDVQDPVSMAALDGVPWTSYGQSASHHVDGVAASASFPIVEDGVIVGTFSVGSDDETFFLNDEMHLLAEATSDIGFSLASLKREEKRLVAESRVHFLAHYDTQTGLPGRQLFENRLASTCGNGSKDVMVFAICLRKYHGVLQLLGQTAGADISRAIAMRLETFLPASTAGRVSESEFVLMMESVDGMHLVEEIAWRVQQTLAAPIPCQGMDVFVEPFVGIALHPRDGTAEDVVKAALFAANSGAEESAACCRFYVAEMDSVSRKRLDLNAALHRALDRNEFELHYQPQVCLKTGTIVGAEALLRWQRPGYGLIPPGDFIPLLENNDLIGPVGDWVLNEACNRASAWQRERAEPLRIAVNLSARQFQNGSLVPSVSDALSRSGLDSECLELELTESIVLLDADGVIRVMNGFKGQGISQALDDFGTGYSSLSYLQKLPVSRLKIDRSFVTHLTSNPSDAAIAHAIVGMAHSLGLKVIAEGVETEGQWAHLHALGCDEIQGFYFSRPVPADEFTSLLREGRCLPTREAAEKSEKVLLILDDEPSVLNALNRLLRRSGYRILTSTSPTEAFNLMATHPVGVVISDQRMVEMTGTEFLRRVKQLHPDAVRIVLSGYMDLNSVIDTVNRGEVFQFITKPWNDEALKESLAEAFRVYELTTENKKMAQRLKNLELRVSH